MAWLTGWSYRKSITLSRASGATTNYQMLLLVGESSGASGEDVDCGGKCASDFDDLRFTNSDETTLLDYWIEEVTGTTPNQLAKVWIEFDSIGTGATTFYMYYGNSGASAVSNGANTFLFFDDFNRSDSNTVGSPWTETADKFSIDTNRLKATTASEGEAICWAQHPTYSGDTTVEAKILVPTGAYQYRFDVYGRNNYNNFSMYLTPGSAITYINADGWNNTDVTTLADTWYILGIRNRDAAYPTADYFINRVSKATNQTYYNEGLRARDINFRVYWPTSGGYVDWIISRTTTGTAPAWGSWGSEEAAPSTGHPASKRMGGVPFAALRRGVW